jgi:hypothetical protein
MTFYSFQKPAKKHTSMLPADGQDAIMVSSRLSCERLNLEIMAFNKKMKKNSACAFKVGNPQWVHSAWELECDQRRRHTLHFGACQMSTVAATP